MKKNSVVIIISAVFLMFICFMPVVNAKADDKAGQNQVLNDEGYGNADAEYYNSEDDVVNDDEPSVPQENSSSQPVQ